MIGWVLLGVYCFGYMAVWRNFVWQSAIWLNLGRKPDGETLVFGAFLGTIFSLFWLPILIVIAFRSLCQARGLEASRFLMPRHVRRERDLDDRERRIRELERELNIR